MRIAVLTDVHANFPALEAALAVIEQEGYDLLVHTGDAISIGPFPAECMDRLLALPRSHLLMGNHDAWFAFGLPQPVWMSDGEVAHQQWTHAQLNPALRAVVAQWPYSITQTVDSVTLSFLHYPLTAEGDFRLAMRDPSAADLDAAFAPYPGDLLFYGHHHPFADTTGQRRYMNPGALGCSPRAEARYCLVEIAGGSYTVTYRAVPYDDDWLYHTFEERAVPERDFIYQVFFGGRFGRAA